MPDSISEKNMNTSQNEVLPGGKFLSWLNEVKKLHKTDKGMDVPCGDCTACCTSSYFIHIRPEEKETLKQIPDELLFPAPGRPKGHVLMGYDENGHCPMFKNNKCSIYHHRPQTCRNYDCRIFTATEVVESADKTAIIRQAGKWQFDFTAQEDRKHLTALRAAARFLQEHKDSFPDGFVPSNVTQQAYMAIRVYTLFLNNHHEGNAADNGKPESRMIADIVRMYDSKS
ncbi:MAG: YkgJ family cysteine cluster protein [Calditrichaceae bacterium]